MNRWSKQVGEGGGGRGRGQPLLKALDQQKCANRIVELDVWKCMM